MEKKEPIKISLPLFITTIVLLVAVISGICVFMQNQKLDKEIASLKEQISQSQNEKNELQEKLNSISNVVTTTEKERNIEESNNSKDQEKKSNSSFKLRDGEYYDLLSSIKEYIEIGGNDNVSGQVLFNSNGKVSIALDVVYSVEGKYTVSGDTITCKMTSISSEGEKEKECNYTVKYKLLHNNGLEVLNSDIKYKDSSIYSNGDMLVCYR